MVGRAVCFFAFSGACWMSWVIGRCEVPERPERFREAQVFGAHEEAQDIAVGLAAEAVEGLGGGKDDKGRRAVFMEGTMGRIRRSPLAQGDIAAYKLLQPNAGLEANDFTASGGAGAPGAQAVWRGRLRQGAHGGLEEPQEVFAAFLEAHE